MNTNTSTASRSLGLRLALGVVGGLVFLIGLLTVVAPSGAADPVRAMVAIFGNDYVLVAVLGTLGLLLGLAALANRGTTGLDQAAPPPPEPIYPVARHGESIDAFLDGRDPGDGVGTGRSDVIRTRLRSIAVTTVMRSANCTMAEARERIETGSWTDEPLAATYLAGDERPGLGARLKAALVGTSPDRQAARVAAAEIAELDAEARR